MIRPTLVAAFLVVLATACQGSASFDGVDGSSPEPDIGAVDSGTVAPLADMGVDSGDETPDVSVDAGPPAWMSAGCQTGGGLPDGESNFMLEGRDRRYVLRLPSNYDPDRAWPIVLALHGNGGNVSYWDSTGGTRDIRAVLDQSAVLVVVEAIDNAWRDYDADPSTWPGRIEEELVYFDHVIEEMKSELCIDTRSIFAMGFSGGGSFSGVLGCRREDIRAIAVGGSVIYFDEANCVSTPAAWITIGTEELTGGREAYRDFFRDRADCDAETSPTAPDPCVAYANCGETTPVHYCQHPDGHIWPAFGTQAMWDFFAQFVE